MKALQEVVGKAGSSMSEASRNAVLALIDDETSDSTGTSPATLSHIEYLQCTDAMAITNARLLGALVKNLPTTAALPLIKYDSILLIDDNARILTGVLRNRVLSTHFTHASVLGLNAVLVESPSLLPENFPAETPSIICQGIAHKDVSGSFC